MLVTVSVTDVPRSWPAWPYIGSDCNASDPVGCLRGTWPPTITFGVNRQFLFNEAQRESNGAGRDAGLDQAVHPVLP